VPRSSSVSSGLAAPGDDLRQAAAAIPLARRALHIGAMFGGAWRVGLAGEPVGRSNTIRLTVSRHDQCHAPVESPEIWSDLSPYRTVLITTISTFAHVHGYGYP
jgi:hypothetical protein